MQLEVNFKAKFNWLKKNVKKQLYISKYKCIKNVITFLPSSGHINTTVWMHYLDANKTTGEEARRQLHKNVASNIEQVLAATPNKTPTIRPSASHRENYPS